VVGEQRSELVQDGRVRRLVLGECVGACPDDNVVAQRPRDERVVGIAVLRVGGSESAHGRARPS
jgi:hypothetical protein